MPSLVPGYAYDIFISYRQKDNKYNGWVTEFVSNLRKELEATFKEDISIYFDENPHDGLLETHDVDESLKDKLKCLIFIPIISQTYCDQKCFAWRNEFLVFKKLSTKDQFGLKVKLANGNVASRILPVRIHDLDEEDLAMIKNEMEGELRAIEFVYKEPGVNRPLLPNDSRANNQNKMEFRNQINKVALSCKEIIRTIRNPNVGSVLSSIDSVILPEENTIAVLPLFNISNDINNEYFSDGLTEELIGRIARLTNLRVTSRTSVFVFKSTAEDIVTIGQKLHVAYIMEGSVRMESNKFRISVRLFNTKDGFQMWSKTYNKPLTELLSLQTKIATSVARTLKIKLNKNLFEDVHRPHELDLLIMKGNYFMGQWTEASFQNAIECFNNALQIDPHFAKAHSGLAAAFLEMGSWNASSAMNFIEQSYYHSLQAIKLDPLGAEAYIVLGRLKFYQFNWIEAEYYFNEATRLNPGSTISRILYANYLTAMGRFRESISCSLQVIRQDPLSAPAFIELGWAYFHNDQFPEAKQAYEKSLDLQRLPLCLMAYSWLLAEMNFTAEAIEFANEALRSAPRAAPYPAFAGFVFARAGNMKMAIENLKILESQASTDPISHFSMAYLYMGLNDHDRAVHELEHAFINHDILLVWLKVFKIFNPIRSDRRFKKIFEALSFPQAE